jgi:DNA-binding MurR/RpiR family transcriptional regulator
MLLDRIRQTYPSLTKSQKRLADFVASNYREVAFMTASRLAKQLSVNEATVIRFAQKLGYPGYPIFVREVRAIVRGELGEGEQGGDSELELAHNLLQTRVEELERMLGHLPLDTLVRMADLIDAAQRTFVAGQGIAGPLAEMLCTALKVIGLPAEFVAADTLSLSVALLDAGQATVLVAVVAGEPAPMLAQALHRASANGATTIALTCSPVAPSARAADLALSCSTPSAEMLAEITPMALLVDAVIALVAHRRRERLEARWQALKELGGELAGEGSNAG